MPSNFDIILAWILYRKWPKELSPFQTYCIVGMCIVSLLLQGRMLEDNGFYPVKILKPWHVGNCYSWTLMISLNSMVLFGRLYIRCCKGWISNYWNLFYLPCAKPSTFLTCHLCFSLRNDMAKDVGMSILIIRTGVFSAQLMLNKFSFCWTSLVFVFLNWEECWKT